MLHTSAILIACILWQSSPAALLWLHNDSQIQQRQDGLYSYWISRLESYVLISGDSLSMSSTDLSHGGATTVKGTEAYL